VAAQIPSIHLTSISIFYVGAKCAIPLNVGIRLNACVPKTAA